ncbi:MAG: DUF3788 family protein [Acidobacteriota bacterium]
MASLKKTRSAPPNLYRAKNRKPKWAEVIRMAGDRTAILFDELRRQLGEMGDVSEELRFQGSREGWTPLYRLGRATLCVVHIAPARMEASVPMGRKAVRDLLSCPGVSASLKAAIRKAPYRGNRKKPRVALPNRRAINSLARLLRFQHKLLN